MGQYISYLQILRRPMNQSMEKYITLFSLNFDICMKDELIKMCLNNIATMCATCPAHLIFLDLVMCPHMGL